MPKRILILSNYDMGLHNFRLELISELITQGYEVHFSVPCGDKVMSIEEAGAIYHPVALNRRGKNPLQDFHLFVYYFKLIQSLRPLVVLTHTAKPNIYGGIACVITRTHQMANITGIGSELANEGNSAKFLRFLYRISMAKTMHVFFENEMNRDYFLMHNMLPNEKKVREDRYSVLPGSGVNVDKFRPDLGRLFSPSGRCRFLFISRIMKDKGIEELLSAAAIIKEEYSEAYFDIRGFYETDKYQDMVEELVKANVISSAEFSNDTRIEMKWADCVVLPSYHEGMSNVLLEAAASGIPLITSNIPGCREAILDGVTGFLCDKGNTSSLAACMRKMICLNADEKKAMGLAGRHLVEERFRREIVVEAYTRRIDELILK